MLQRTTDSLELIFTSKNALDINVKCIPPRNFNSFTHHSCHYFIVMSCYKVEVYQNKLAKDISTQEAMDWVHVQTLIWMWYPLSKNSSLLTLNFDKFDEWSHLSIKLCKARLMAFVCIQKDGSFEHLLHTLSSQMYVNVKKIWIHTEFIKPYPNYQFIQFPFHAFHIHPSPQYALNYGIIVFKYVSIATHNTVYLNETDNSATIHN